MWRRENLRLSCIRLPVHSVGRTIRRPPRSLLDKSSTSMLPSACLATHTALKS